MSQPSRLKVKRVPIWHALLKTSEVGDDYQAFKQRVLERPVLIEDVEEVIRLDVHRSKHSMPHVDEQALLNLLKTFAFFNREIEYCQGMNYIAGFLLALFHNEEETAFRILQQVAVKYNMHELFNPDIPRLKLYFLQLDRMLAQVN